MSLKKYIYALEGRIWTIRIKSIGNKSPITSNDFYSLHAYKYLYAICLYLLQLYFLCHISLSYCGGK